jgi:hypothetical protein
MSIKEVESQERSNYGIISVLSAKYGPCVRCLSCACLRLDKPYRANIQNHSMFPREIQRALMKYSFDGTFRLNDHSLIWTVHIILCSVTKLS